LAKKKKQKRAQFRQGSIKDRVFNAIVARPDCEVSDIVKVTKLKKSQVASAIIALRGKNAFPADSKWARGRQRKESGPTVTQDEIILVAGIGVEKVKEILKLLTKLGQVC